MRSIGSVYVTVLANSKQFTKDAKKAAEDAGKESQKAYAKEFKKAFSDIESSPEFKEMADKIAKDWERIAQQNGTSLRHGVADARLPEALEPQLREMAKRFDLSTKEVAKRIAANLETAFRDLERPAEEAAKRYEKAWDDALKEDRRRNKQRLDGEYRLQQDILKAWDQAHAHQRRLNDQRLAEEQRLLDAINRAWDRAYAEKRKRAEKDRKAQETDNDRVRRSFSTVIHDFQGMGTRIRNSLKRAGTGGWFDSLTNAMAGLIGLAQGVGSVIGKPIELAIKGIGKAAEAAGSGLDTFGTYLTSIGKEGAGNFVSGLGKAVTTLGELAPVLAAGAAGAIALVAGLLILETLLGAVVAAISALAGMVVILGSAIAYALGYLIVFAPAVAALGAAAAVLATSMSNALAAMNQFNKLLNDKTAKDRAKDLKKYNKAIRDLAPATRAFVRGMEPLLRAFNDLQAIIAENFFKPFTDSLAALARPEGFIAIMATGLERVATALGKGVNWVLKMMDSQEFLQAWGNLWGALAPIVEKMTIAVGGALQGIVGFLGAIAPFTEKLAGWFANIMINFGQWATSAAGQNTIEQFMKDAEAAAGAVWDAIMALIQAFGILLGPEGAQKDGKNFLQGIKDLATTFKNWVDGVSKDGRLKAWLDEAKTTATNIWEAVKTIGQTFRDLNTQKNRDALNAIIGLINLLAGAIDAAVSAVENLWNWLTRDNPATSWLNDIAAKIGNLPGDLLKSLWPHAAAGMITTGPTIAGEAGTEAIIPLTRPLSMIDPSVRGMAAMIRGEKSNAVVTTGNGKTVTANITVVAQSADPAAVAQQVLNRAVILTR